MKQLKKIIQEKLKITSNTKIYKNVSFHTLSQKEIEKIEDEMCDFFQTLDTYNGRHFDNRLQILDKYFDKNIYNFMDYYTGSFDDMGDKLKIDVNELTNYIKNHNEELYKIIHDFVL